MANRKAHIVTNDGNRITGNVNSNAIVEALTEYFKGFSGIENDKIFVDFLKEKGRSFSIVPSPIKPVSQHYIDDSYEKQFSFSFVARFNYSHEKAMNIANSTFFEDLEEWLIYNNDHDILPQLKGYKPISIEITSNGYLLGVSQDGKTGQYEIRCLLIYEKE